MRTYREVSTTTTVLHAVTCDDCHKDISLESYWPIEHTFGYPSRLDGDTYTADLCEDCILQSPYFQRILHLHQESYMMTSYAQLPQGVSLGEALQHYDAQQQEVAHGPDGC